jgi:DNA-binding transcriptional regulator YiaG
MTPDQFRTAINKLGLSQVAAARLFGVDEETSRQWANGERDIPAPAVRFLHYLIATRTKGRGGNEGFGFLGSYSVVVSA